MVHVYHTWCHQFDRISISSHKSVKEHPRREPSASRSADVSQQRAPLDQSASLPTFKLAIWQSVTFYSPSFIHLSFIVDDLAVLITNSYGRGARGDGNRGFIGSLPTFSLFFVFCFLCSVSCLLRRLPSCRFLPPDGWRLETS